MQSDLFAARFASLKRVLDHRPVKVALACWTVVCTYDTLLSQILPASFGDKFPRVRDAVAMSSGWLPFWAWLLILAGILTFAAIEYAHRRAARVAVGESDLVPQISHYAEDSASPGFLDFIVEGVEAIRDIGTLNTEMGKEALALARSMNFYKHLVNLTTNPKYRRWIATRLAKKMAAFAARMQAYTSRLKRNAAIVDHNYMSILNQISIPSIDDLSALNDLRNNIGLMTKGLIDLRDNAEEARLTFSGMLGISRDLNIAATKLTNSIAEFRDEIGYLINLMQRMDDLCQRKSNLMERHI